MKQSSQSAYTSLIRSLEKIGRNEDIRALRVFLASDHFMHTFGKLAPDKRHQVLVCSSNLMERLKRRIGPLIRETPTKAFKWNEVMIARLRKAEARYGNDEDIARALALTVAAVRRARHRFIGPRHQIAPATADQRIAA